MTSYIIYARALPATVFSRRGELCIRTAAQRDQIACSIPCTRSQRLSICMSSIQPSPTHPIPRSTLPTAAQRFSCAVLAASCLVWFAATFGRAIVTYDLYQPTTTTLRPLPQDYQLEQLRLAENLATIAWAGYGMAVGSVILMLGLWRSQLRQYGYVPIAALLVLASTVWQAWVVPTELALFREFPSRWSSPPVTRYPVIMELVTERFFRTSAVDVLNLLTAASTIIVLIVQPRNLALHSAQPVRELATIQSETPPHVTDAP